MLLFPLQPLYKRYKSDAITGDNLLYIKYNLFIDLIYFKFFL